MDIAQSNCATIALPEIAEPLLNAWRRFIKRDRIPPCGSSFRYSATLSRVPTTSRQTAAANGALSRRGPGWPDGKRRHGERFAAATFIDGLLIGEGILGLRPPST